MGNGATRNSYHADEDRASYLRWRRGVIVFYGVVAFIALLVFFASRLFAS